VNLITFLFGNLKIWVLDLTHNIFFVCWKQMAKYHNFWPKKQRKIFKQS
jgi:hypothetical protein